ALLSGGKVIVSTGTKTLQDQLFQRDLPLVRDALKVPVTVALLKGRGNYVCHHHLARAAAQSTFASRADVLYLKRIGSFARTSTLFFGEEIGAGQLGELARDAEVERLRSARDYEPLRDAAQSLAQAMRRFRLSIGDVPGKVAQTDAMRRPDFDQALQALAATL